MTLHLWLAFAGASMILLLIPGPTVMLVIGDALANHGRSPWSTIAGVAVGDTISMSISLAGAGTLLAASALAFTGLKIIGGAYLVYLGLKALYTARQSGSFDLEIRQKSTRQRLISALTVTTLNPKSIVFFVAFVPQFIAPDADFVAQSAVLVSTFVALAVLNTACYALAARLFASRLTSRAAQRRMGYTGGVVMLAAGSLTLAAQART